MPLTPRSQCASTDGKTAMSGHETEIEKLTPYPMCYANLLAGRSTGVSTSTSPRQIAQPGRKKSHGLHIVKPYFDKNFRAIIVSFFVVVVHSCFR